MRACFWRRLYVTFSCKDVGECWLNSKNEWRIDAGYCIDRYSLEDDDGNEYATA